MPSQLRLCKLKRAKVGNGQRARALLRIKPGGQKFADRTLALLLQIIKPIVFITLILVLTVSVQAQKPQPTPSPTPKTEEQEPVKVFTEEVRLQVAALDQYGHYDPALELNDVLVLEDGVAQQVRSIQHLPANVLLLLDTGNQLGLKNTNITRDVGQRVIDSLSAGNRIAVMQFTERPELLQTWTADKAAARKALRTKIHSGKNSRLSEAIAAAAAQFKDIPIGTRHIVLITDGVEGPGGRFNLPESLKQLNSIQASVHIISYTVLSRKQIQKLNAWRKGDGIQRDGNPGSNPVANGDPTLPPGTTRTPSFRLGSKDTDPAMLKRRKEYERATIFSEAQLSEIAEESGGQIWLPESTNDLLSEAESIARDIGSQYVITYRPTRPLASAKSGEYRKVEVASRRVGLYLRSRQVYVVP
jgi:VWFA-related protein